MHQIPAHETSVTLFSSDGGVWVYRTMKAALNALGQHWIAKNVGPHFRVFRHVSRYFDTERECWVRTPEYDDYHFIMRDDFGAVVTAASFDALIERKRWRSWWERRYGAWNGEGPVPGTRCHRGGGHCYRRPKTMNERRQAALILEEEGEVAPRPTRDANNLPNSWDDYWVSARDDRNWKRYRKHQWKN